MGPMKDHHGQMAQLTHSLKTMRTSCSATMHAMQTLTRTTREFKGLTIDSPMEDVDQVDAETAKSAGPIIVLIASPGIACKDQPLQQRNERLMESMNRMKDAYEKEFDTTHSEPYTYLPFLHQPDDVLPTTHEVPVCLSSALAKGRRCGAEVVLLISGGRILLSNKVLLEDLFNDWRDVKITLQIFTEITARFSRVDGHMLQYIEEDIHTELLEDSPLPNDHCERLSQNVRSMRAMLEGLSKYSSMLQHRHITSSSSGKSTNNVPPSRDLKRKRPNYYARCKKLAEQGDKVAQERLRKLRENGRQRDAKVRTLAEQGDKVALEQRRKVLEYKKKYDAKSRALAKQGDKVAQEQVRKLNDRSKQWWAKTKALAQQGDEVAQERIRKRNEGANRSRELARALAQQGDKGAQEKLRLPALRRLNLRN